MIKHLLFSCCLAFMSMLCPCMGQDDKPALLVGICDPLAHECACDCVGEAAQRKYEGLKKKLEAECGASISIEYYEEDPVLVSSAKDKKYDILITKAWTVGQINKTMNDAYARVADIQMPADKDKDTLWGEFVVKKDSPIKTIADIKGKRLVLGPKTACEKYQLALQALTKAGIAKKEVELSEQASCKNAVLDVLEDMADVAAISSYAVQYGCVVVVADPGDIRTIATTVEMPFITVALANTLPAPLKDKITKSLLDTKGDKVPSDMMSKGITPTAPTPKEESL